MKIRRFFLPFMLLCSIISSCKKSNSDQPVSPVSKVISYKETISSPGSPDQTLSFNIGYDNQNRVTSIQSVENPLVKFNYRYSNASMYTLDLLSYADTIHEKIFVNNNSLIDSTVQFNGNDTSSTKYLYNGSNQLISEKSYFYGATGILADGTINYTYDSNGYLILSNDGAVTTTFDYYPNLVNNITFLDLPYSPNKKGLIKTVTSKGFGPVVTNNHSYTFDSQNRIITDNSVISDGTKILVTYTYL